jgi:tRNA (guanine10-N2)-methyltransferase
MIVEMESEKEARLLGSRAISVKHIWEFWGDARTYDELHTQIKGIKNVWVRSAELQGV